MRSWFALIICPSPRSDEARRVSLSPIRIAARHTAAAVLRGLERGQKAPLSRCGRGPYPSSRASNAARVRGAPRGRQTARGFSNPASSASSARLAQRQACGLFGSHSRPNSRARLDRLIHAAIDPVHEGAEIVDLGIAHVLEYLATERRSAAGRTIENDRLVLGEILVMVGVSASARNSSMPRDTCTAPAILPVFSTSGASRTSTTSVFPFTIISFACAGVIRGTAALAASIICFTFVGM